MPTYEYQCKSCKAVYELRQGFDAETTHKCEECGKGIAKRILHAPPVVFKGGGWYATDSRNKSSAMTDSESKGDSDSKSSATSSDSPSKTESPTSSASESPAAS
ncbi:MAG: FmdB family zinc ribbon protein [Dehalococcoidia bacterium]